MNRRAAFVLSGTDFGPMLVNRLDFCVTPEGAFGVGCQLLEKCSYEAEEIELIVERLKALSKIRPRPITMVDCGANIGAITVPVSKAIADFGHIVAFEPQDWIFYALCGNIVLNNCWNVTPVLGAIGDTSGSLNIPSVEYRQSGSFGSVEMKRVTDEWMGQNPDYSKTKAVSMYALDNLDQLGRIDFLKIDVEGMESEVLDGALKIMQRDKPTILVEHIKSNKSELGTRLVSAGYDVTQVGMNLLATSS